jgi:predicted nucleic acid-binding protein
MGVYFDSAIIAKLFCLEANSAEAAELVAGSAGPHPLTHLQMAEVRNAIRLKRFRGEITDDQLQKSLAELDRDVTAGHWQMITPDVHETFNKLEELSAAQTPQLGCRTLDILHVAAALIIGAERLASFDQRQRSLARHAGLQVVPD